jgi:outer membrane protein
MYLNKTYRTALLYGLILSNSAWAESLTDIYQSALQNDPVLATARANFKAGLETKKIARAALLPQLAVSGEYSESESEESERTGYVGESLSEGTRYGVSLSQAIFDMPAWYQFLSGQALSSGAAAQFSADQQRFIMRVSQAYLNVLRTYDNRETRKAEQRAISQRLEQTKERFEVGLVAITDVHEAQAFFDDAIVNSLEAQGALNIAFEGLQVLTGKPHTVLSGLADSFKATAPDAQSSQDWVDLAVENNFQLRVAELGKDAAYSQARAAAMARLPKVTGNASYFDSDNAVSSPFMSYDSLNKGHQFAVSVTMPIWLGGGVDASRRQAKQQAIAAEESYLAAKRNTVQSARSQHQLVVTNGARVKARKQAITSADSALQATQAGYEVGTRTIIDVLAAQRTVYQAKRNYANARYDFILSMMGLKEVTGQLSPDDIYQLNGQLDPSLVITR